MKSAQLFRRDAHADWIARRGCIVVIFRHASVFAWLGNERTVYQTRRTRAAVTRRRLNRARGITTERRAPLVLEQKSVVAPHDAHTTAQMLETPILQSGCSRRNFWSSARCASRAAISAPWRRGRTACRSVGSRAPPMWRAFAFFNLNPQREGKEANGSNCHDDPKYACCSQRIGRRFRIAERMRCGKKSSRRTGRGGRPRGGRLPVLVGSANRGRTRQRKGL